MKTVLMAIDNTPVAKKVISLTIEEALAHRAEVMCYAASIPLIHPAASLSILMQVKIRRILSRLRMNIVRHSSGVSIGAM